MNQTKEETDRRLSLELTLAKSSEIQCVHKIAKLQRQLVQLTKDKLEIESKFQGDLEHRDALIKEQVSLYVVFFVG